MKRITVLLADDHYIVRKGFLALLEIGGEVDVVGEAQNGFQAVQMAGQFHPAVVLMDIAMPKLNGIEAARQIIKSNPAIKILMLSGHEDDAYVDEAMDSGVSGYLLKQGAADFLTTAIQEVAKGNIFLSPAISGRYRGRNPRSPGASRGRGAAHVPPKSSQLN